jgi:energy-converting hydrogenase B subunit D
MTAVQLVAFVVVAVSGTAVVFTREPLRQALVAGIFGLSLAALATVLQAPDVALSQIGIGAIVLPVLILLALAKIREHGS